MPMVETIFFLTGFGFSIFVYFRSIKNPDYPALKKAWYAFITFIGITGILLLVGVMIAHVLSGGKVPR